MRELLIDEVAGLRVARGRGEPPAEVAAREREALASARRRALFAAALDAVAVAVLFLLRDRGRVFFFLGPAEEAVFTLGVLLVTAHLGFRLGQYLTLSSVSRLVEELLERDDEGAVSR